MSSLQERMRLGGEGVVVHDHVSYYALWFLVLTSAAWIVFWTLNLDITKKKDGNGEPDPTRVLFAAVITALVILVVIWFLCRGCGKY